MSNLERNFFKCMKIFPKTARYLSSEISVPLLTKNTQPLEHIGELTSRSNKKKCSTNFENFSKYGIREVVPNFNGSKGPVFQNGQDISIPEEITKFQTRNYSTYIRRIHEGCKKSSRSMSSSNFDSTLREGSLIEVSPRVAMHDVKTQIKVEGLKPNQEISLRMDYTCDRGNKFCCIAHYISDENGTVDCDRMPSVGGDYKGVFPSGLLMTLHAAPELPKETRILKTIIETPMEIHLSLHNGHRQLGDSFENLIEETILERYFVAPGVRVEEVDYKGIYGKMFIPPGDGPFPGVIDMYGGSGGCLAHRPALLSSHGIAALALAFSNYKSLPKWPEQFDVSYFRTATEYVMSQKNVIPDRCGTVGHCLGGIHSLLMGATLPSVKAVVAINATHMYYGVPIKEDGKLLLPAMKNMPSLSSSSFQTEYGHSSHADDVNKFHDYMLKDESIQIPLERTSKDAHYYFIYSGKDTFRPFETLPSMLKKLEKAKNYNHIVDMYPKAGHFVDAPYINFTRCSLNAIGFKNGVFEIVVTDWGGTAEANSELQESAWPKIIRFIEQNVRDKSQWYQNYLHRNQ